MTIRFSGKERVIWFVASKIPHEPRIIATRGVTRQRGYANHNNKPLLADDTVGYISLHTQSVAKQYSVIPRVRRNGQTSCTMLIYNVEFTSYTAWKNKELDCPLWTSMSKRLVNWNRPRGSIPEPLLWALFSSRSGCTRKWPARSEVDITCYNKLLVCLRKINLIAIRSEIRCRYP